MELRKKVNYQCAAIVQPGEYSLTRWDNKRCEEDNPLYLIRCEVCHLLFCHMHWHKHEQPCNYPGIGIRQ
jgi:hypothetical protein